MFQYAKVISIPISIIFMSLKSIFSILICVVTQQGCFHLVNLLRHTIRQLKGNLQLRQRHASVALFIGVQSQLRMFSLIKQCSYIYRRTAGSLQSQL